MGNNENKQKSKENSNTKTLFLIVGLIVIIAGAYFLYNNLADNYKNNSLVEYDSHHETAENPDTDKNHSSNTDTATTSNEKGKYEPAPDFTVYDADGNTVKLSDFKGTPVVVNFWASWCGPCKSEMPDFESAYQKYGNEICFLIVNMTDGSRETVENASAYINEKGYTFPVFFDSDMSAAYAYTVSSIPASYFIDKDGNLVAGARGAVNFETIENGIEMIR
ncbi:MAG: TlpA family protein disulfide reductase [Clostridia bacterium]|nr:TlpA family protein disulfide reductase [Clostridia bacterium]